MRVADALTVTNPGSGSTRYTYARSEPSSDRRRRVPFSVDATGTSGGARLVTMESMWHSVRDLGVRTEGSLFPNASLGTPATWPFQGCGGGICHYAVGPRAELSIRDPACAS